MPRALISLYVLLTTPIPVPWTLLARGAAVVLAYVAARMVEPWTGLSALGLAVVVGLLTTTWRNLARAWVEAEARGNLAAVTVVTLVLALCAGALCLPAEALKISVSLGLFGMAALYALVLWCDPDMLDQLGWKAEHWGNEGRANAARWQILRCVGLGTVYAYSAYRLPEPDWIVAHAALPLVFYALFHWSVIATHPLDEDA